MNARNLKITVKLDMYPMVRILELQRLVHLVRKALLETPDCQFLSFQIVKEHWQCKAYFSSWRLCSRDVGRKQEFSNMTGQNWLAKKVAANK